MRISTNYIYGNIKRTIQQSVTNLLEIQEVMASQRKINHLEDDPVGVGRVLNTGRMIHQNDQFIRNLDTATTISELYDGSLNSAISLLDRAKELILAETNSATSTAGTREAARVEIVSLASQMVAVANLQYADRFLYAGYADDTAPFEDITITTTPGGGNTGAAAVTYQAVSNPAFVTGDAYSVTITEPLPGVFEYSVVNTTTAMPVLTGVPYVSGDPIEFDGITLNISDSPGPPVAGDTFAITTTAAGNYVGDNGTIRLEVEQDVFETTNLNGNMVFQGAGLPGGLDFFAILETANVALRTNDQVQLEALLTDLDDASSQARSIQSIVGARENLFEGTQDRLLNVQLNLEILLSDLQDADITDTITELNRRENSYQAVLAATSKIIQPTLLDFLR